jgi:hypothetical protein
MRKQTSLTLASILIARALASGAPPLPASRPATTRSTTRPTTRITTQPTVPLGRDGHGPERETYIRKAQKLGLFGKIKVQAGVGTAEVSDDFLSLDYKSKSKLARAVYDWCDDHDSTTHLLILKHITTGAKVGTMTPELGLKME